jgi:hypothetical protein
MALLRHGFGRHPLHGDGTRRVLTSDVSRMFPVSDAGLGAFAYTVEFLMAWMGGRTRWRSMPWMVTFFFIVVVPLGLTHVILVILQPVAVGAWCTLCLAAAFLMLVMIPFTVDEVVVTGQFLRAARRDSKSLWRTFWAGGTMPGGSGDERTPRYGAPMTQMGASAAWGVTVPWTLIASALTGISVMFAPVLVGTAVPAAHSDQVTGALVVTVAVIATAEVVRALRFLNVLFGTWIAVSGWMLSGATVAGQWSGIVAGAADRRTGASTRSHPRAVWGLAVVDRLARGAADRATQPPLRRLPARSATRGLTPEEEGPGDDDALAGLQALEHLDRFAHRGAELHRTL